MTTEIHQPAGMSKHTFARLELIGSGGEHCVLDAEGHCITCSDEATPARVLQIDQEQGIALVEMANQTSEVDITLVDAVTPGSWLLVHGGTAIATFEEQQSPDEASNEQR